MMQLITIATSIAFVATTVLGSALPAGASMGTGVLADRSNIVPMIFRGTIGGVEHSGEGTSEEIFAAFEKIHPQTAADVRTNLTTMALETRGAVNKEPPHCCGAWNGPQGWGWADSGRIREGINYLSVLFGECGVQGGPGACTRISCSYNAGIYLCNDNSYAIFPNCGYLASYADDISGQCFIAGRGNTLTCGQQFDTDNYNVCVHSDRC
ncbi:hypothetical protein B0J14DRAFT_560689 [Halenospora varia]|nr:hypothetical protein B0J14DRAFT_560689 [Halenospora varia]